MDIIAALFGAKVTAEKVKEWSESLGEGIVAGITAQLPFEASLIMTLKKPLSMRIDKVCFKSTRKRKKTFRKLDRRKQ